MGLICYQLAVVGVLVCGVVGVLFADGRQRILDLTYNFDNNTVHWPTTRKFEFTKVFGERRADGMWYALNEFCTGEHVGTHFDAPYHFFQDGWKVAEVPLERLVTTGISIDMKNVTKKLDDKTLLLSENVLAWEERHGQIKPGVVVLVNFGWSKYYDTAKYLSDKNGNMAFPGISKGAAELLTKRKIVGIGLDTPSVDPGNTVTYDAHKIFARNNIYNIENAYIPEDLPEIGFTVMVMPMKIREGTGAPLRLVALLD